MISLVKCDTSSMGVKEEEQSPCLSWSYCFVELTKGTSLLLSTSPLAGRFLEGRVRWVRPSLVWACPKVERKSA